jgi:hypothetical protein
VRPSRSVVGVVVVAPVAEDESESNSLLLCCALTTSLTEFAAAIVTILGPRLASKVLLRLGGRAHLCSARSSSRGTEAAGVGPPPPLKPRGSEGRALDAHRKASSGDGDRRGGDGWRHGAVRRRPHHRDGGWLAGWLAGGRMNGSAGELGRERSYTVRPRPVLLRAAGTARRSRLATTIAPSPDQRDENGQAPNDVREAVPRLRRSAALTHSATESQRTNGKHTMNKKKHKQ